MKLPKNVILLEDGYEEYDKHNLNGGDTIEIVKGRKESFFKTDVYLLRKLVVPGPMSFTDNFSWYDFSQTFESYEDVEEALCCILHAYKTLKLSGINKVEESMGLMTWEPMIID